MHTSAPCFCPNFRNQPWQDIPGCQYYIDARDAHNDGSGFCDSIVDHVGGAAFTTADPNNRLQISSNYLIPRSGIYAEVLARDGNDGNVFRNADYTLVGRLYVGAGIISACRHSVAPFDGTATLNCTLLHSTTNKGMSRTDGGVTSQYYNATAMVSQWVSLAVQWSNSGSTAAIFINGVFNSFVNTAKSISSTSLWLVGYAGIAFGNPADRFGFSAGWNRIISSAEILACHTLMASVYP